MRALLALVLAALSAAANAQTPAAEFPALAGKTIRIIIGGSATGTTGQYARPFAEALKTLLSGSDVVIQNIEGGGGILALVEAQAATGSAITVAIIHTSPLYRQMLGLETAGGYDLHRFHWLGALTNNQRVVVARASLGADTMPELLALGRRLVTPVETVGSIGEVEATLLSAVTELSLEVVVGIEEDLRDALLLAGGVDLALNNYLAMKPLLDTGAIVTVLRLGGSGYPPELDGVPTLAEIARPGTPPALIETIDGLNNLGRMVLAAPATSPEAVDDLRRAFDMTVASSGLAATYAAANLNLGPTSGAELAQRIGTLLADPAIAAMLNAFIDCGRAEVTGPEQACVPAPRVTAEAAR